MKQQPDITLIIEDGEIIQWQVHPDVARGLGGALFTMNDEQEQYYCKGGIIVIPHSLAMRIFKLMAGMGSKNHWKTKTKKEKKEHTQKARDMIKKK